MGNSNDDNTVAHHRVVPCSIEEIPDLELRIGNRVMRFADAIPAGGARDPSGRIVRYDYVRQ